MWVNPSQLARTSEERSSAIAFTYVSLSHFKILDTLSKVWHSLTTASMFEPATSIATSPDKEVAAVTVFKVAPLRESLSC